MESVSRPESPAASRPDSPAAITTVTPPDDHPSSDPATKTRSNPTPLVLRPPLGTRLSSGSIIIPRDSPTVEMREEHYAPGDARAMSPRRSMEQVEKMGEGARKAMETQARTLQANLLEIVDRVEAVKTEHEKLEGGNKFLQSYIGELMQTSKITSTGASTRARGRN